MLDFQKVRLNSKTYVVKSAEYWKDYQSTKVIKVKRQENIKSRKKNVF